MVFAQRCGAHGVSVKSLSFIAVGLNLPKPPWTASIRRPKPTSESTMPELQVLGMVEMAQTDSYLFRPLFSRVVRAILSRLAGLTILEGLFPKCLGLTTYSWCDKHDMY